MPPFRILVVDDSAFMRKFISDIISKDSLLTVVGTAKNGLEAIEAVKRLSPDVVTLDVEMPEMNGLEALPVLMKEAPTPIVMLSSSTHEGAAATIKALELGAFDFVPKPSGTALGDLDIFRVTLIRTIRAAVDDRKETVVERLLPASPPPPPKPSKPKPQPPKQGKAAKAQPVEPPRTVTRRPPSLSTRLVAIGTSTGGPRALQTVLTQLPEDFPAPILVVQHMPPGFTKSLAQRLNTLCSIQVTEAEDGMEMVPGTAYIARGGVHMTLVKELGRYRLRLTEEPPRNGHRPSVDVLFESLLPLQELDRTVVIMTGMGSDGARGMKLLHDHGVRRTIAEAQSSCIVYGMPKAAVELGCVSRSIPLDRIAHQIIREVSQSEEV